jgi:prolyl-tRNA synthetase
MDEQGKTRKYYMGCYGIGIGRTMAAIVEKYHDTKGMIWLENIAPFQVHLLNFSKDFSRAEAVYEQLKEKKVDILYDDRTDTSPGEKMNDADLIGIPVRLVISDRTGDKIELKRRNEKESKLMTLEEVVERIIPSERNHIWRGELTCP